METVYKMDEDEIDRHYTAGVRAAMRSTLSHCLSEIGVDDVEAGKARWVIERLKIISALRSVCADFGDNAWPDDADLAEVIEKHLARHLEE